MMQLFDVRQQLYRYADEHPTRRTVARKLIVSLSLAVSLAAWGWILHVASLDPTEPRLIIILAGAAVTMKVAALLAGVATWGTRSGQWGNKHHWRFALNFALGVSYVFAITLTPSAFSLVAVQQLVGWSIALAVATYVAVVTPVQPARAPVRPIKRRHGQLVFG